MSALPARGDKDSGWVRYTSGEKMRCPKCSRTLGDVPRGTIVYVRALGRHGIPTRGAYHRICQGCRAMLQVMTGEDETT